MRDIFRHINKVHRPEPQFQGSCAHQHTVACDRCEDLKNAIADLQLSFDSQEVKFR